MRDHPVQLSEEAEEPRAEGRCSFTHRLQQSSRRRGLLSRSRARPRRSQHELMPLPLDWNQRQLRTLALLLFNHGGSRSPRHRHGQTAPTPSATARLVPTWSFPSTSGLERPIGFQYSPRRPRMSASYWSGPYDVTRVRFQDWRVELAPRLRTLRLVGGSALAGFWGFAQCSGAEAGADAE